MQGAPRARPSGTAPGGRYGGRSPPRPVDAALGCAARPPPRREARAGDGEARRGEAGRAPGRLERIVPGLDLAPSAPDFAADLRLRHLIRATQGCERGCVRLLQRPEDDPHQVAFETAERLFRGLALGALLGQVGAGRRVHANLGEDDLVERRVQLAVAQAREPVAAGAARGDLDS